MHSSHRILTALLLTVATTTLLTACGRSGELRRQEGDDKKAKYYENIVNSRLDTDPSSVLSFADSLQQCGAIPEYKALYFRAQAYYKMGQELTAELLYKKALIGNELYRESPTLFYYACDQLSTILTIKGEQQGAIDYATKGYELARKEEKLPNKQWAAILLHDIGYCQMRLDRVEEAENNFLQAFETLKQLAATDSSFYVVNGWARVAYNILDAHTSTGHYQEADRWIKPAEEAIGHMVSHSECPQKVAEEYRGSLNTHKAIVYVKTGRKKEANESYRQFLRSPYAQTSFGLIDNSEYLSEAGLWRERSALTPQLDSLTKAWDMPISLYYLATYLVPDMKAYLNSGQQELALKKAKLISNIIDSVVNYEQRHNAAELSIIYETQEKEMTISNQASMLKTQRLLIAIVALLLTSILFAVVMALRSRAAKKLAEKNRELERKNLDLTVANARAEDSARMKSNFIQQISHEIRTPLNILSGFTQIITAPKSELDEDERLDISQRITENTNRITSLVNKILELSDAGSQSVIELNDDTTPEEIALRAVNDTRIQETKHINFRIAFSDKAKGLPLHTNLQQAANALACLLDNAQKFTREGEVVLTVTTDIPQRDSVAFIVEDTGIGIPVYESQRIFNDFVQLDEYSEGMGIGLTIARKTARRLGGDIVHDTTQQKGARFVMTLPAE